MLVKKSLSLTVDMISSSLPLSADSRWSVASLSSDSRWSVASLSSDSRWSVASLDDPCNCVFLPESNPSPASLWSCVDLSSGILKAYITHKIKYKIQHQIQHTLYNNKIKYNVKCKYIMHHHIKFSMPNETYNHIHEKKTLCRKENYSKSKV